MKNRIEYKFLVVSGMIFIVYFLVILSNIAVPILYHYFMLLLGLMTPFIIGFFLAFLLHTVVDKIEEQGINRAISVLMVFLVFILIFAYLISSLIPIIFNQINELETQIPKLVSTMELFLNELWTKLDFVPLEYQIHMDDIQRWSMSHLVHFNLDGAHMSNLLDTFNLIVLSPIVTYYFLYDYNHIKQHLRHFLEKHHAKVLYQFIREADEGVGAYFRGLILVMNLLAIASSLGFYIIGLPYPLLFGFIVGYTDAIPLIGEYIGGIPAVLFALTISWKLAILTFVVIIIIQMIESNIVTPYVQSKSIDSHPLLIIFAFILFGKTFGFLGMIFAIPLLALFVLILKYFRIYFRLKRIKQRMLLENK